MARRFCSVALALPGAYCILLQADDNNGDLKSEIRDFESLNLESLDDGSAGMKDDGGDGSADVEEWTLAAQPLSQASGSSVGGQSTVWTWKENSSACTTIAFSNSVLAPGNHISNESIIDDLSKKHC